MKRSLMVKFFSLVFLLLPWLVAVSSSPLSTCLSLPGGQKTGHGLASGYSVAEKVGWPVSDETCKPVEQAFSSWQSGFRPQTSRPGRYPANFRRPEHLAPLVRKYAKLYRVEEKLVWAVMRQESGFNASAVSPKGAMGLMQLMPETAVLMGVTDPFNLEQNIAGGIRFLRKCLNRFNEDVVLALAAYNAGPESVDKYNGCPPYSETQKYVASIMAAYAGQPWEGTGKRLKGRTTAQGVNITPAPQKSGLDWKIKPPQVKIKSPQWKISGPRFKTAPRVMRGWRKKPSVEELTAQNKREKFLADSCRYTRSRQ